MGHLRRRSVDVGGLALALGEQGRGHGWGGWEEDEKGGTGCVNTTISWYQLFNILRCIVRYAEVLIDVRAHTDNIVNLEPLQLSV